ncbi:hypothetical protein ACWD4P_22305 [Kitasatospora sp. NPDC002543]
MLLELRCAVRRTPPPAEDPGSSGSPEGPGGSGPRRAALCAAFLAVALAGVVALVVLGYAVEALVTVIVTAAAEACGAAARGRR